MSAAGPDRRLFIGLMSGTSLDGIDAVLVDLGKHQPSTIATHYASFDAPLHTLLSDLQAPSENELHRSAIAGSHLAQAYARSVEQLLIKAKLAPADIEAIGAHGQTVRHCPDLGFSIQLNNPALLAELTGISVIADFRSRDIAAGGQGAPLVPAFHQAAFAAAGRDRVVVNIGGIANISILGANGELSGWDTGPGNGLMDFWIGENLSLPYDAAGAWASTGTVLPQLLANLLAEPYFSRAAPKSTGRDLFRASWLVAQLDGQEKAADVQATLCALTAQTITEAITGHTVSGVRIEAFLCGGGAHNKHLVTLLQVYAPHITWKFTDSLGIPADWVEAVAFAWLARQFMDRRPASNPVVTGAKGPRLLGALYPA